MARFLVIEDSNELGSLLVATARARGHAALHALSGAEASALLTGEPFQVAIVDLHLPDMAGAELLELLRQKSVPTIAMSGVYKGDRYAKESVDVHGAKAFFEKPFTMSELLLAAENAAGVTTALQAEPSEDSLEELEELAPIPEDEGVEVDTARDDDGPQSVRARLPFAERDKVWARTAEPKAAAGRAVPSWAQSGALTSSSVPKLLGAYYQAKHTGELKLKQNSVLKIVYFEAGRPAYAASNLVSERFARFCVRRGVLTEADMTAVAQLAQEQRLRTGEAMEQLGLVDAKKRTQLLEEQVKEIIWSTFSWTSGDYTFTTQRPNRPDMVKLNIFPGDLILEGISRSLPLVQLRQKLPAQKKLFPTADPPYALHELKLNATQARLVAYCDGTKSVEDLLQLTEATEREALAALVAFELMGLVEPREQKRTRVSFGF